MVDESLFSSLKKPLSDAREILIFLPENPGFDRTAAALGVFLSLKKAGKKPTVLCPSPVKVEVSDLVGIDKIRNESSGQNLVITFDYVEDSIEKVSYHIEDQKFKLVIKPKAGFPPLKTDKIDYSHSGGEADLVFLVGTRDLKEIKGLVDSPEEVVKPAKTVLFDTQASVKSISDYEMTWLAASFSEIAAYFINQMRLPVDADIAGNLFKGIEHGSRSFSSPRAGATTFEAAAFCLRAGAQRQPRRLRTAKKPQGQFWPAKTEEERADDTQKPTTDWLEPKIYNGGTRI